jgi:hypothetical protein
MGVPCHLEASIVASTHPRLADVTSILFRAVAKMISELSAVVVAIAR